jgi:2'-5' RNA ligase
MPYAVTLLLDDEAARKVTAAYAVLSRRNVSHDQIKLGYPPHITLAVLDDGANPGELTKIVSNVARRWQSSSLNFVGLGVFPGKPSTLWLCPAVTSELSRFHSELCAALPRPSLSGHYLPNRWVPHLTLAKDLSDAGAAVSAVDGLELPLVTNLVEVNLIHFRPPKVIWRLPLERK